MICASYLGSEVCYAFLPFVYLVFSRSLGQRLFLLFSLNGIAQNILKLAFQGPRPYWLDSRIKSLGEAGGFGMPSGHTQSAMVLWPYVARSLKLPGLWLIAAALVLVVAVSRAYLGVHFISDTLGGLLVGAALLMAFILLEPRMARRLAAASFKQRMSWALAATMLFGAVGLAVSLAATRPVDYSAPMELVAKASRPSALFLSLGLWFGASVGLVFARRWAAFEVGGVWWRRLLMVAITLGVAWGIRKITHLLPDITGFSLQCLLGFIYGAVINLWMVFIAPWAFLKLRWLSNPPEGAV